MAEKVVVTDMREHHVDQVADLLVKSFMTLNNIWKKHNHSYEELCPIIRSKVLPCVAAQWSYVLLPFT